jgi:hypothetical protein
MTLRSYRPTPEGGLEPAPTADDYRTQLRSRRWNAAPLENPEVDKTNPWIAVGYIAALSAVTFVLLVLGYATGFWG